MSQRGTADVRCDFHTDPERERHSVRVYLTLHFQHWLTHSSNYHTFSHINTGMHVYILQSLFPTSHEHVNEDGVKTKTNRSLVKRLKTSLKQRATDFSKSLCCFRYFVCIKAWVAFLFCGRELSYWVCCSLMTILILTYTVLRLEMLPCTPKMY